MSGCEVSWPVAPSTEAATDDELDWRRPHPITILVEIGTAVRSVLLAVIVVRGGFLGASALLEFAVILTPLGAALARWYTTRYALGTESMHHQYGLLRRRKQVLPRANVQNVSTKAGIFARLASVVELQISDASSSGDIKLRLVSHDEAERLTTLLRSSVTPQRRPRPEIEGHQPSPLDAESIPAIPGTGSGPFPDEPSGAPVQRPALIVPPLPAILAAEATSMPVAGALVASVSIAAVGFLVFQRFSFDAISGPGPLVTVVVLSVVPVVSALLSVVSRLLVLVGFRLDADPDRLRIQAGLLTETKVAVRRERLQQINVVRDLPHQWLGIERVRYETADVELQTTAATRFLDPAGRTDGWKVLAVEAFGIAPLDETALAPVSRLTIRRMMIRLLPLAVVPAAIGALIHPVLAVVGALGWFPLGRLYATRRFAILGWALDDQHYMVRTGVFHGRLNVVRLDKIQSLRMSSTFFQRRLGLATVSLSTAGAGLVRLVTLPDLHEQAAEDLLDRLASRSARTPIAQTL